MLKKNGYLIYRTYLGHVIKMPKMRAIQDCPAGFYTPYFLRITATVLLHFT